MRRSLSLRAGTALSLSLLTALLSGCGSGASEELTAYREGMDAFYDALAAYDSRINEIDALDENAPQALLAILTEMDESYRQMAALSVPEEFAAAGELAEEAAANMDEALSHYRAAYADGYDAAAADVADQYYARAGRRAQLILTILHGEIPEGEDISVETEESLTIDLIEPEG